MVVQCKILLTLEIPRGGQFDPSRSFQIFSKTPWNFSKKNYKILEASICDFFDGRVNVGG